MREYGQVQSSFWTDPDIQTLSDTGKLLATYLLTSPHSNGIGCYRLPDGYISADFGWDSETITKGFQELFRIGFCKRCETSFFVLILKFLKWNPIANSNVAKAREKEFKTISNKSSVYNELCFSMLKYGNHLSNGFETLLKRYAKQDPTQPNPTQKRPNPTLSGSDDPDGVAFRVIKHLNAKTGAKYRTVETNKTLVRARLAEGYTETDLIAVVDSKCTEWLDDKKQSKFLRPSTLFGKEKFSQYAGQAHLTQPQENKSSWVDDIQGVAIIEGECERH